MEMYFFVTMNKRQVNDVIKEEMDTMVENKIEPKDVNKYLSSRVREMFFKLV